MLVLWLTLQLSVLCGAGHATNFRNILSFTTGLSGDVCGAHTCLDSFASCEDGRCRCQSPFSEGIGNFLCVKPTDYYCAILNDPMVIGFDGSKTNVPLISKFFLTYVSTMTCSNSTPTFGNCGVYLSAWAHRVGGKTFIRGFEAYVNVFYNSRAYSSVFRVATSALNGNYTYMETSDTIRIPGHTPISVIYDTVNNFARLNIEACGVEVGIRGVEQEGSPLNMPAGVYIRADTECDDSTYIADSAAFVCSAPVGYSLDNFTTDVSNFLGRNVTRAIVLLFTTLARNGGGFDGQAASFTTLVITIRTCPVDRVFDALELCSFIIDDPRFFKCYDHTDDGNVAIGLMNACCSAICSRNQTACEDVKEEISSSGCSGGVRSPLETILNKDCNF